MLSNILDKISFWSLFLVVTLLPIFFIPLVKIPADISKSFLLVIGLTVSLLFWAIARFTEGEVSVPKSKILLSGLVVVLVALVSALFSPAMQVSMFGIMLDAGTFYFILCAFLLMFLSSIMLNDSKKIRMVLVGLIASSLLLFVFQIFRIFFPTQLSLGILGNNTGNLFGSWNNLGIFAGFSAILSILIVEFLHLPKYFRWGMMSLAVLSILFVVLVNLNFIWIMLGVFSLFVFIYKISFSYDTKNEKENTISKFPFFALVLMLVSLLFLVSGQFIGGYLPTKLGLSSVEVAPSYSATYGIIKNTIMNNPVLGSGLNRFSEAWNLYKDVSLNTTSFWNYSFKIGFGLFPTFAVTSGILGILSWLIFFGLLIWEGIKAIFISDNKSARGELALIFILTIYLFFASIFYFVGSVVPLLAFAFAGIFVGLLVSKKEKNELTLSFVGDPRKSFFLIMVLVLLVLTSVSGAFKFLEKFASIPYFEKALSATEIDSARNSLSQAIGLHQNDLYLRTYAQLNVAKMNEIVAGKQSALSQEDQTLLQGILDESIGASQLAIAYDPTNYLNHNSLGFVYNTAGSFGVEEAYNKAMDSYKKASTLNPLNPGVKLTLARIAFSASKTKEAKEFVLEALKLKPDYIEAMIVMSQIEKSLGNNTSAISYAEKALAITPFDKNLTDYVRSLKSTSSTSTNSTNQ
ncbi:MAG: tetratricopeptide repeat protein [Candidatus Pacebacteria bacterium]|nr:tetratricopeptide repeat protein [Candidatus Paceibacterota bacterium]MCF7863094.1 tetratricopeptide repeat protein [Candidatus Paceibacterota bacterium]